MAGPTLIATSTGLMDVLKPDPKRISLRAMAMGLSRLQRWTGQGAIEINVASHSLLVSQSLDRYGAEVALYGLLHDGHEYILGDIATPRRNALAALTGRDAVADLATVWDLAIWQAFGLRRPTDGEAALVHQADQAAAASEFIKCFPGQPSPFTCAPVRAAWTPIKPAQAEEKFIRRFHLLAAAVPGSRGFHS